MLHPFLKFWLAVSLAVSSVAVAALSAQGPGAGPDDGFLKGFEYRLLGPFRGGRSAAVEGVIGQPQTYYMGTTGGGVWRTDDGGTTWRNISDGYFGGSIGAVAAAPSDPNILYVGGGEVTVRGNVSSGQGMWKSIDGGKTWKAIGLEDSRHIPRIRVHPKDPNLVYVAALGHLYGPNRERGVFRSRDGGATWEKVLYVNDEVGACDLIIDPSNPRCCTLPPGGSCGRPTAWRAAAPAPASGRVPMVEIRGRKFRAVRDYRVVRWELSASQFPQSTPTGFGRSSKPTTAGYFAAMTRARPGSGSMTIAICGNEPGITRASMPDRKIARKCTS